MPGRPSDATTPPSCRPIWRRVWPRSVGAQFDTHAIVVDAQGLVRDSGGVDSDMVRLKPDATPHLRNALDELLAGRTPEIASRALGCTLQLY